MKIQTKLTWAPGYRVLIQVPTKHKQYNITKSIVRKILHPPIIDILINPLYLKGFKTTKTTAEVSISCWEALSGTDSPLKKIFACIKSTITGLQFIRAISLYRL